MAKAIKLDIAPDFNFKLIGIVSSEPIYRLGWLINEALGIALSEKEKLVLVHQKSKIEQLFDLWIYNNNSQNSLYELVQNKCYNGFLIEEQKQIDYFIKVNGNAPLEDIKTVLKTIHGINMAIEITPGSLKSKNRLIWLYD